MKVIINFFKSHDIAISLSVALLSIFILGADIFGFSIDNQAGLQILAIGIGFFLGWGVEKIQKATNIRRKEEDV